MIHYLFVNYLKLVVDIYLNVDYYANSIEAYKPQIRTLCRNAAHHTHVTACAILIIFFIAHTNMLRDANAAHIFLH